MTSASEHGGEELLEDFHFPYLPCHFDLLMVSASGKQMLGVGHTNSSTKWTTLSFTTPSKKPH